jgi:hypothetical protein
MGMSTVIDGSASVTINSGAVLGITSGTAVASTSGTSIDFTSIPSWVKRITVLFDNVSTSSTNAPILRLGTGGTPESTGYIGYSNTHGGVGISYHAYSSAFSTSFILYPTTWSAAYPLTGKVTLTLLNSATNTWVADGIVVVIGNSNTQTTIVGSKPLAGVLDMIRITINGTDTFDAGTINIMYEG